MVEPDRLQIAKCAHALHAGHLRLQTQNVEQYGTAGQATDCKVRACIACWTPKATNTKSVEVIPLFCCNNGCMYAPHCYVAHKLPALLPIK
jgi:hypothetical protein